MNIHFSSPPQLSPKKESSYFFVIPAIGAIAKKIESQNLLRVCPIAFLSARHRQKKTEIKNIKASIRGRAAPAQLRLLLWLSQMKLGIPIAQNKRL
jgi:hypothetical protein